MKKAAGLSTSGLFEYPRQCRIYRRRMPAKLMQIPSSAAHDSTLVNGPKPFDFGSTVGIALIRIIVDSPDCQIPEPPYCRGRLNEFPTI